MFNCVLHSSMCLLCETRVSYNINQFEFSFIIYLKENKEQQKTPTPFKMCLPELLTLLQIDIWWDGEFCVLFVLLCHHVHGTHISSTAS